MARGYTLVFPLLLLFALLLGAASSARAATVMCSQFSEGGVQGVIDGYDPATKALIDSSSTIGIDMDCVIKNFPESVGGLSSTLINFQFPTHASYLIIFDNVYYEGNMSCNDPTHSTFAMWWSNGSYNNIPPSCQEFMIPVDGIRKNNPAGQTTASIGVPFTYTLTFPDMAMLTSSGYVYSGRPDTADIYHIDLTDDLTTTGADLTYLSNTVYLKNSDGTTTPLGSLVNSGDNKHLSFLYANNQVLARIQAGQQLVLELTVVLDNTAANVPGTQFINTAHWELGRMINGTNYEPLPGQDGITPPMTIVGPNLVVTKTSSMSNLNMGDKAPYTINVQNIGSGDAWNTTITDNIPAGMCTYDPRPTVTAQIFASGGTQVSGPLVNGTDFSVTWNGGSASACQLSLQMLTAAAKIGPTQRLIVNYQAALDPGIQSGMFTNVAGATRWFSADSSYTGRSEYDRTLTDGTPGVLDFQDAYTITAPVSGYYLLKTVQDLTSGIYPAIMALPGDRLRFTLQIQNSNLPPLNNVTVNDDLGALNAFTAFVPGSLSLAGTDLPAGTYTICSTCGTNGAGTVAIHGLTLGSDAQYQIRFDVTLASNLANGTIVRNQASLSGTDSNNKAWSGVSDDPYINGRAMLGPTGDPTPVTINSTPAFRVLKTVQDITSGTSTVKAGDTLRYTIRVNNIGAENAVGVTLRDLVPSNTTYVEKSTTLNGQGVADPDAGVSALQNGMLINSPANLTPGVMPADASAAAADTATITFEVKISASVVDGTVISNQGFVDGSGAGSGPFPEQPSDDPTTPVLNDPTRVVVGNVPLVYALKTVKLFVDNNGDGFVDPGDVLRYTITLTNSAATPATGVVLTDAVPANTTYVANSTTLNGSAVADPGAGVSYLANGMGVVSSGLTPPSPPSGGGTLAAHGTGTVTFDVQVNAGVPSGTIISNQGAVTATQLPPPPLPTDSDGDPTNGYQPTVIVVGNAQQLSITKSYAVLGGGAPLPGSIVEYTVKATNIGTVAATGVVITDDLNPISAQVTYVSDSATMNGSTNGVSYASSVVTANYGTTYGTLAPGGSVVLRFRVTLNSTLTSGTPVTNKAQVIWNSPTQTAEASVTFESGPQSGSLNGRVWQDANFNKSFDGPPEQVPGVSDWAVDVYRDSQLLGTVHPATDGTYQVNGLAPNAGTTSRYELRFRAPDASSNTAMLGWADSPVAYGFTNGMQHISNIVLPSGSGLQDLNLPLTPNGVVYNSVTRTPIAGATLTMVGASTRMPLPTTCFNDPAQQGQVTLSSGYYKFDLNFSDPSCPSGGDYLIQVTPPASGYSPGLSKVIPPASSDGTSTFSVPTCPSSPADAVPGTTNYCEAQASDLQPGTSVSCGPGNCDYYLHLTLAQDSILPAASQIYNNHIAIDPTLDTAVAITKTAALINVTRGGFVPYTITLRNTLGVALQNLNVVDTFPPGFKYVAGSGRVDGQKSEPAMNNRQLIWNISQLSSNSTHTINLLMIVGSGVSEDEYVNLAQVINSLTGANASSVASATVRVVADPTFDCTDVIGKVFDDRNLNGRQDPGEKGLTGVRVVTARGLIATSDKYGRFHITCVVVPDEDRGSNLILKLDERSLPTGYRLTTENPSVQRATRGMMLRFNFGATIHRVVRIDLADGAFEPDTTELRMQWTHRIERLLEELKKGPSVLRLSYLVDVERRSIVQERLEALKKEIIKRWKQSGGGYRLDIETEIFWRRGAPLAGQ
jgi:uncharacterized repeat protein (TIGR01451 family)